MRTDTWWERENKWGVLLVTVVYLGVGVFVRVQPTRQKARMVDYAVTKIKPGENYQGTYLPDRKYLESEERRRKNGRKNNMTMTQSATLHDVRVFCANPDPGLPWHEYTCSLISTTRNVQQVPLLVDFHRTLHQEKKHAIPGIYKPYTVIKTIL